MERSTQWAVVLTGIGIVALALSAATLPSAVPTDTVGADGTNASGSGILPSLEDRTPGGVEVSVPEWLATAVAVTVVAFAAVYVFTDPRNALFHAIAVSVAVLAVFAALFVLTEIFDALTGGDGAGGGLFAPAGGLPSDGEVVSSTIDPSLVPVAVVVGLVVLLAAVAFYGATGDATGEEPPEQAAADGGDGATVAGVGRAAGRAADRIEAQAGVDNEVYRAWREMAGSLSADEPETSTPGEFADAAVDAGMDPDDVEELTRLFEEVRYGDAAATADREQRAVSILRRIEATYGGGETEWT